MRAYCPSKGDFKSKIQRLEMAWQLRALVDSQQQCSNPQPSVTLVPRDLAFSSDLHRHQPCTWYVNTHMDKTLIHRKTNF